MLRKPVGPTLLEMLESRRLLASDLTASLSVTPGAFLPGNTVNFQFTVRNDGTTTVTPTFSIEFRLTKNLVFGDADDVGRVSIPVSQDVPGGNLPFTVAGALPLPAIAGAGQYFIGVKIDSANTVGESNETNNISFTSLAAIDILGGAGTLVVPGTSVPETIQLSLNGTTLSATVGAAAARSYSTSLVRGVIVQAGDGNDTILVGNGVKNVVVYGDSGNDSITDGDQPNTLNGGGGRDIIRGGPGNDRITGGSNHDQLFGENGSDRIFGDGGNDMLDGGSHNDRLDGGIGTDSFFGGGGNDIILARDLIAESIFGASGVDSAQVDAGDVHSSIETLLA